MSSFNFPWLSDEEVEMPSAGVTFTPSGFIAKWIGMSFYRIYSMDDLSTFDNAPQPDLSRKAGDGTFYYFSHRKDAEAAAHMLEEKYGPSRFWQWATAKETILNFTDPEVADRFQNRVSYDIRLSTLKSLKYRHEWQLIVLPSIIQAVALHAGVLDERIITFEELLNADREVRDDENDMNDTSVFTDAFYADLCGDPDEQNGWLDSVLGKKRAELWMALGEPNVLASATKGPVKKYLATPGTNLANCMRTIERSWGTGVWARVVTVPDPRVDAVTKDDRRLSIATLHTIFESEQEARETATEEVERILGARDSGEAVPAINGTAPSLPSSWEGTSVDEFVGYFKEYAGKPVALVAKEMDMSAQLVEKWSKYLGL